MADDSKGRGLVAPGTADNGGDDDDGGSTTSSGTMQRRREYDNRRHAGNSSAIWNQCGPTDSDIANRLHAIGEGNRSASNPVVSHSDGSSTYDEGNSSSHQFGNGDSAGKG